MRGRPPAFFLRAAAIWRPVAEGSDLRPMMSFPLVYPASPGAPCPNASRACFHSSQAARRSEWQKGLPNRTGVGSPLKKHGDRAHALQRGHGTAAIARESRLSLAIRLGSQPSGKASEGHGKRVPHGAGLRERRLYARTVQHNDERGAGVARIHFNGEATMPSHARSKICALRRVSASAAG